MPPPPKPPAGTVPYRVNVYGRDFNWYGPPNATRAQVIAGANAVRDHIVETQAHPREEAESRARQGTLSMGGFNAVDALAGWVMGKYPSFQAGKEDLDWHDRIDQAKYPRTTAFGHMAGIGGSLALGPMRGAGMATEALAELPAVARVMKPVPKIVQNMIKGAVGTAGYTEAESAVKNQKLVNPTVPAAVGAGFGLGGPLLFGGLKAGGDLLTTLFGGEGAATDAVISKLATRLNITPAQLRQRIANFGGAPGTLADVFKNILGETTSRAAAAPGGGNVPGDVASDYAARSAQLPTRAQAQLLPEQPTPAPTADPEGVVHTTLKSGPNKGMQKPKEVDVDTRSHELLTDENTPAQARPLIQQARNAATTAAGNHELLTGTPAPKWMPSAQGADDPFTVEQHDWLQKQFQDTAQKMAKAGDPEAGEMQKFADAHKFALDNEIVDKNGVKIYQNYKNAQDADAQAAADVNDWNTSRGTLLDQIRAGGAKAIPSNAPPSAADPAAFEAWAKGEKAIASPPVTGEELPYKGKVLDKNPLKIVSNIVTAAQTGALNRQAMYAMPTLTSPSLATISAAVDRLAANGETSAARALAVTSASQKAAINMMNPQGPTPAPQISQPAQQQPAPASPPTGQ